MFYLFQASEILGCPPWVLADQPVFWQESAFFYRRVMNRIPEIREGIEEQRAKMAGE